MASAKRFGAWAGFQPWIVKGERSAVDAHGYGKRFSLLLPRLSILGHRPLAKDQSSQRRVHVGLCCVRDPSGDDLTVK